MFGVPGNDALSATGVVFDIMISAAIDTTPADSATGNTQSKRRLDKFNHGLRGRARAAWSFEGFLSGCLSVIEVSPWPDEDHHQARIAA